jgi:hypothetical protein
MVKTGQAVICDTAPMTFAAFNSRMHDPKRPGDLKKVKGDPLDDVTDETLYVQKNYFDTAVKPAEVAAMERLKALQEKGLGETSLVRHMLKLEAEQRRGEAPTALGHRRLARIVG